MSAKPTTSSHESDSRAERRLSRARARRGLSHGRLPAPAILIGERDPLMRWAMHESLREAGFRLLPVSDGAHARELTDGIYEYFALAVIDDASWTMTASEVALAP